MPFASLNEWLTHLETLHPRSIDLGLDRIKTVQQALSLDSQSFKIILVAGTNGKGSTCTFLADLLFQAGYRTGLFTSPHVLHYRERIRINKSFATDAEICEVFEEIDVARGDISLTYFEFGTLAAALLFRYHAMEFAVMEVGLGGRLDAVNIFSPVVSVITSVAYDHQDWLGQDLESIGLEKAGIMRPGIPCLLGERDPPESLVERARDLNVPLLQLGREFQVIPTSGGESWQLQSPRALYEHLPIPGLRGEVQLGNAALAIGAAEAVLGEEIPRSVVTSGLENARLLGRQQVVKDDIETIFDVAHNPSAARVLAQSLGCENKEPGNVALLGMYADKDIKGFVSELAEVVVSWHVMPIQGARAESPHNIGEILHDAIPGSVITVHEDRDLAIETARQDAFIRGHNLLVTGSFETVGAVLASRIYCSKDAGSG